MKGLSDISARSVKDVPFAILADLYAELRVAKFPSGRKRGRSFAGSSRYDVLTAGWRHIVQQVRMEDTQSRNQSESGNFVPAYVFPPNEAFILISLIVPSLDSAHSYLGMKETKLAEAFIRALNLVSHSSDAQWLRHYKEKEYRPQKWKQDADIVDGNLATVLGAMLQDRCPSKSSLTIGMVWEALDSLGQVARGGSRRILRFNSQQNPLLSPEGKKLLESSKSRESDDFVKVAAIRNLVARGTAREVSEVARIILKDLNVRLSEDVLFKWFHPAAEQHYKQIHDIHKLLQDCSDPNFEIGDAYVQLGQYASVMLTMRPSRKRLNTICEELRGEGDQKPHADSKEDSTNDKSSYFMMEPKLDGERLQLHKWRSNLQNGSANEYTVRTYSRRGNDSSAMYAEALTGVIMSGVHAEDIILDGEIMIWDELMATWVRFEDFREISTSIAKKTVPEGSAYVLKYMVFDVLYIDQGSNIASVRKRDGSMVIQLPLHKRRVLLEKLITAQEISFGPGARARIEVVTMERGTDEKQLTQALQRFETLGYEGVIAKNPDMPYVLAERSLNISIKLKPDYFDGGIQDLDVLILGARYSTSSGHRKRRAGNLSSFLIGVRASEVDTSTWRGNHDEWKERTRQCKWIPVGSVGSGYSDDDLARLRNKLAGEWKDFSASDLPDHFERRDYAPNLLSDVAKWIQPWQSVVLTVRAYELNRRYYALRFPRVERVNWEKPYFDVPTFTNLLDLDENKIPTEIRSDEKDPDDIAAAPHKKQRGRPNSDEETALKQVLEEGHTITGGRSSRAVIDSVQGADVSKVTQKCRALADLCFWVIASNVAEKENLEVKIHELGGRFTQNLTPSVDYVICTTPHHPKLKSLAESISSRDAAKKDMSIVLRAWVDECHTNRAHILPRPKYVIFASASLHAELYKSSNRYGDSWSNKTTAEEMEELMKEVKRWASVPFRPRASVLRSVDRDIEERVESALHRSGNTFSSITFCVPHEPQKLHGTVALLKALGARERAYDNEDNTHVLLHSSSEARWKQENICDKPIVNEHWVRNRADRRLR